MDEEIEAHNIKNSARQVHAVRLRDLSPKPFCSVQFSRSVISDSLKPHGLQHTRPLCPSPTPRACSNSCLPCRWWTFRLKCFCFYFYLVSVRKPKEIQMNMIALRLLPRIALQQKWQKSLVHQDMCCVPSCYPTPFSIIPPFILTYPC